MTGQSGFLDSFLKFLEGDENGPMTKPVTTRKRLITSKKEETKPPGKVKRSPGRPRKYPEVRNKKEKEKLNCESEGSFTEKTNEIEALDSVESDSQNDTKSPGKIKRPPGRPRKYPEVINIKEKEKLNCEFGNSLTEKTNETEALGSVNSDSQNDTKPPGKIKRPPGRPRKNPEVIDIKEKEKVNCESEDNVTEKTNEIEALDSVDSDSQNDTKPLGKIKRSPGRPRKNPEVIDIKEKEKVNCESEDNVTEKTNEIEALDSVDSDSQNDTKPLGKIKRSPGRPRKNPEVIDIKEKEKVNCESEDNVTEKTNEIEALDSVDSDSQNDTKPLGKIKRSPGRPRKNPEVIDIKEKEKVNCESEDSVTEKTNEIEALDSVDSDSQIVNRSRMLEVLREKFNKCFNEKVERKETNGEGEVIEMKDLERVKEDKMQNGESISTVREDLECKAGDNKVNFALNSGERKNSVDGTSNCSEKEISNLTDKDENVSRDSASESAAEQSGGRGRKRKKMTDVPVSEQTPRRELSARKAKRKPKFSYIESESEDNPDFDEESNSDNDPVWTPNEKKISSDEEDNFEWKERQNLLLKPKKFLGSAKTCPKPIIEKVLSDAVSSTEPKTTENVIPRKFTSLGRPRLICNESGGQNPSLVPFQSGSFIALKEELEDIEEPTLWRVDGKALLQKYEPFRADDGSLRYRNVSTYSGWGPKNRDLYQPVPVRFLYQNRFEYIVEIIKEELIINEDKLREKLVKDLEKHSMAYEVYLQTLVSQALDSNFLNEIVAEKDDYFLTSMGKMDGVCEEKKKKLLQVFEWNDQLKYNLSKWPILEVEAKNKEDPEATCQVCLKFSYHSSVDLGGETYSNQTLECISSNSELEEYKTFLACKTCLENIQLFNQIAHLKYHTYKMCVELVKEKEASNGSNDNTKILHDILADGPFITKKFQDVTLLWAEADLKSRKKKTDEITLL